jgi:RNA polymerase sigma-70 factor (ECF subfamily)
MNDRDVQLMLAFQRGDPAAFDTLFQRYTPPLLGFLGRMLQDNGRAEELAQEVFVRIYQAKDRYEPRARFSTWMFGIAHRLALNELARARHRFETRTAEPRELDCADPAPDPGERIDAQRSGQALERALATLPERQRAAILLRSEGDMDYAQIAQALDTSVASVKSLLHRAREGLLRALDEEKP